MTREHCRLALYRFVELPGAKLLRALGLTPNVITVMGFCICLLASAMVAWGWLVTGGIVFLLGSGLDLFDGGLARLNGSDSNFGAFLDSVFDRLGESALFIGLAVFFLRKDLPDTSILWVMIILLLALVFSQSVSYLRARGEGLGVFTKSGLMTRAERVAILGTGLVLDGLIPYPVMMWVLGLIAVVSCFTLIQRMCTIGNILNKGR